MRNQFIVPLIALIAACDANGSTGVELPFQSYVLSRVDGKVVPAEVVRTFTVTSTQSASIRQGSLNFITADSADLTLHTDFRTINESGEVVTTEEMCAVTRVAYRLQTGRVLLDLEIPPMVFPPSTGQPPRPGVSFHDTLFIGGGTLSGAHDVTFSVQALQNRRVQAEYFAAPLLPNPCGSPNPQARLRTWSKGVV